VPESAPIVNAALTFSNIRNWTQEDNLLSIYLVDYSGQAASTTAFLDNQSASTGYLSGLTYTLVGTWSDILGPYGENAAGTTETFTLNASLLATLNNYAADGSFGFIIDPDCHYYNDGVTFSVTTRPSSVPEGGSTLVLLALGLFGIWGANRRK
jgi:hypothetical protein